MNALDPLDLSKVDPPVWRVMVKDVAYGPYTLGQMRSFVQEGRLTLKSRVAEGDGGAFLTAADQPALGPVFREHFAAQKIEAKTTPANHLIATRAVGDSRHRIIAVLNEVGAFAELMPGIFLLNTTARTATLRERLGSVCDDTDKLVIVNADTGRLAWLGLGPEADTHIRTIWATKD